MHIRFLHLYIQYIHLDEEFRYVEFSFPMGYFPYIFKIIWKNSFFVKYILKSVEMTKKELAKKLDIDVKTLDSWEEKRPEVMRLIRIGLATEEHAKDVEKYLAKLKDNISEKGSSS